MKLSVAVSLLSLATASAFAPNAEFSRVSVMKNNHLSVNLKCDLVNLISLARLFELRLEYQVVQ